jgi:hypothetical protein
MVWLVIAGMLLPLLGFIVYTGMAGGNRGAKSLPRTRAAATVVGKQPLSWRVLDKRGLLGDSMAGGLLTGNFDGDVDEELLRIGQQHSHSYDHDGARHNLTLGGAVFSRGLTAWDYDADGTDEVLPDPRLYALSQGVTSIEVKDKTLPSETPVFSVAGEEVTKLPGFPLWSRYPLVGDVAGNGKKYLLLDDAAGNNVSYGRYGEAIRKITMQKSRGQLVAVGDVLGEGRECLITIEGGGRSVMAYDRLNNPHFIGTIPKMEDIAVTVSDVNRDKKQDIIFGAQGYLNAKSGWIPLKYKPAAKLPNLPVLSADVLKKGSRQIIVASGKNEGVADELLLFDKGGNLIHHERFARPIIGLARIRSPKQDYVCVQFEDRLLIYP